MTSSSVQPRYSAKKTLLGIFSVHIIILLFVDVILHLHVIYLCRSSFPRLPRIAATRAGHLGCGIISPNEVNVVAEAEEFRAVDIIVEYRCRWWRARGTSTLEAVLRAKQGTT